MQHAAYRTRSQTGIGIQEEEPITLGLLRQLLAGEGLAVPALWQVCRTEQPHPVQAYREISDDIRGAIGGGIIIDQDLAHRIPLEQEALQANRQSVLFISGRD
jgi:hypothetical protein